MFRLALHWQIFVALLVGAGLGLVLNVAVGERTTEVSLKGRHYRIHDSTERITIELWQEDAAEPTEVWVVDPAAGEDAFLSLAELKKKQPAVYEIFRGHGRSTARWVGDLADSLGRLFLRLLRMVSVPLIITSLLTGVMGLASATGLGRMFGRTMIYYVLTSMLAIVTGLVMVNTIRPGERGQNQPQAQGKELIQGDLGEVLYEQVEALIPPNPIGAAAEGNFLSIIAFSLAFGLFAVVVGGKPLQFMHDFAQAAFEIMMAMTLAIIHLAPLGVFFLMLNATATQGIGVFQTLGLYMLTVLAGLLFHAVVTLPLILHFVARRSPWQYAQAFSPALLTAFSSASSNATLPLTMTSAEQRAGINNRVASFVLPLGATINMDGTALFEVVAVLFIAQLEPSIQLGLTQQVMVALTALLASIGAAGIPHAGLVMMVIVLQAVGLPADKVGIILAVDRVLDMFRTSVNVWSDACGCAVLARFEEGEPELERIS